MRILQVIEFFSPRMGGSAQVAYQVSRRLPDLGHSVEVWASDYGSREVEFPGGDFRVRLFPATFARWGFYPTPTMVPWARDHIHEFDIIHLHNLRTFQNLVVALYARRYGVPYILQAHGSLPYLVERVEAKRLFDLFFGRRLVRDAAKLIAISPAEVDQYREAGVPPEKIVQIYNGLDLAEYQDLPLRGEFRQSLGIPEHTRIILFLGRIHKIKGIDVIIEAFGQFQKRITNSLLLIAGPDDGELEALQALVSVRGLGDLVRFTGPLYGRDKLAAYQDANLLASPGAYEIFGLVPFEALMCGAPVVVGQDSSAGQVIAEAGAGALVPAGDVEALADAILQSITNPEETQKAVARGQDFIRNNLGWGNQVAVLKAIYISIHT